MSFSLPRVDDVGPRSNLQDNQGSLSGYTTSHLDLKKWVEEVFVKQNPSSENISSHAREYQEFREYLAKKAQYYTGPTFIEEVFNLITSGQFEANELQHLDLKKWVEEVFVKQNPSSRNISSHAREYREFRKYLADKGLYQPDPTFIKEVFDLITSGVFKVNELQTLETMIFCQLGGFWRG